MKKTSIFYVIFTKSLFSLLSSDDFKSRLKKIKIIKIKHQYFPIVPPPYGEKRNIKKQTFWVLRRKSQISYFPMKKCRKDWRKIRSNNVTI